MNQLLEKLIDFHRSFKVNIEEVPNIPMKDRCELRQILLEEELNEFKEAWETNDIVEVADALADIQYVLLGTVLEFGLQDYFAKIFDEVHISNMSKLDKNGKAIRRKDGKVIKSDQFFPPNIHNILKLKNNEKV